MGLPRAMKAHLDADLQLAEQHYKRALAQKVQDPVLFQNYGALLREQNRLESAESIYTEGNRLFPTHAGILANWSNLVRVDSPALAISLSLEALRLQIAQGCELKKLRGTFLATIAKLRELKLFNWALSLALDGLERFGPDSQLLLQLLLLLEDLFKDSGFDLDCPLDLSDLVILIETQLEQCEPYDQAEIRLGLASYRLNQYDLKNALDNYEKAINVLSESSLADVEEQERRQKLVDINSWNFGCMLLQSQELRRGWQLYEYGLRTPAEGKQRWQRALQKPFSSSEIALWRGESLVGQRLLLLEEQAIGDAMMFITLVPTLLEEASSIGLLLSDRLLPIYRRSLEDLGIESRIKVWSFRDVKDGLLTPDHYTRQSPLGSICQHRFMDPSAYGTHLPLLKPKPSRVKQLRSEYCNNGSTVERLIGISWRGGGRGIRIKQKSFDLELFEKLIQPIAGVRFVSLQYGKAGEIVDGWRAKGIDVIHDPRVNPLKQMDLWLAQVAACDAVLSVANTTIHGAGGLGIPTLCLLSVHSDWRWFVDPAVKRSYWYPSVGIARESKEEGWHNAILQARTWLEKGCPLPTGPAFTTSV